MPLPEFNTSGDLPAGVHKATWDEVLRRFGADVGQRALCTRRLSHINALARRTGFLARMILFGSYVTAKSEPNDIDILLIMDNAFRLEDCPLESRGIFEHALAQARYGASIFWMRPTNLIGETLE